MDLTNFIEKSSIMRGINLIYYGTHFKIDLVVVIYCHNVSSYFYEV